MNEIALAYYAQHTMTHGTAMQIAATEAVAEIERLRAALLKIATTKGFGPDGPSLESWKHWADQAQDALTPNVADKRREASA